MNKTIIDFHNLFYDSRIFKKITWLGHKIWKNPLDLWIYQEIIHNKKPELIIETGSYSGASAHFLASMMNLSGIQANVISVDIIKVHFPKAEGLQFITGSSIDINIFNEIKEKSKNKKTMVILDSDHNKNHVLQELNLYSEIVSTNQYLIIEDTNLNGHPVISKGFNGQTPGPWEAVEEFMKNRSDFTIDTKMEKLLLTMHPNGFLLKNV